MKRILILAFFVSKAIICFSQKSTFSTTRWKDFAIVMYFDQLEEYRAKTLPSCHNFDRNMDFDISRKMRALNEYPLDTVMKELKKEIKKNKIEFDSIIMLSSHGTMDEELDKWSATLFYIFNSNRIDGILISYLDDNYKVDNNFHEMSEAYQHLIDTQPACDYGYFIITAFDRELNWHIRKLIINPTEFEELKPKIKD